MESLVADTKFSSPGGAMEIKTSSGTPSPDKFAMPGGATDTPTGSGPNRFPTDLAGEVGFKEGAR